MPHVRFDGVDIAYDDERPVLEDLSFDLDGGWTGVVGDNGAGKTTLLRALVGDLHPRAGTVHADAPVVAFVRQRVDTPDEAVRDLAYDWSKAALRWRARLDLTDGGFERWSTLSEGQRKRWQVAAALAARPDLLVLDEPTNHLDPEARGLLLEVLEGFKGVGVVVSHDRGLLEALTTRTLIVADGGVRSFACAYREARAAYAAEQEAGAAAHTRAKAEAKAARARIAAARQRVEASMKSRSTRARMKNAKDRAAGSTSAKYRAEKAEAAHSRRASTVRTRADQAASALEGFTGRRDKGTKIVLEAAQDGLRRVVDLVDEPLVVDAEPAPVVLVPRLTAHLERGQRVHLAGPNGAGKSTLLERLEAACRGRVVRVDQDRPAEEARAAAAEVRDLEPEARGRVLQLAAALGADPAELLDERPPTPGQAQKLALAAALGQPYDLVLLDEPTSHLDLPAVERLQDALTRFEGTLVLVTHDDELAAASTDLTWRLADGHLST